MLGADVPCADVLNVFYADGSYRSMPSAIPAVISGTTIGTGTGLAITAATQPLSALSFFDNVQQRQTVFVGNANGVQQLAPNGTWLNVSFFLNSAQVNINSVSFWSFGTMGPYVIAVPYTPLSNMTGPYLWSDQGLANNVNTFTQPAGAPGGRVGAVVSQFFMVGDIISSQTQVIATGNGSIINFSGFLSGTPMLAAGSVFDALGTITGTFNNGLITGQGLVTAPVLPGFGTTLNALGDVYTSPGNAYQYSIFALNTSVDLGQQSFFSTITVNGVTRNTAFSTYSFANGVAIWTWNAGAFGITNGSVYPVTFVPASFSTTISAGSAVAAVNGFSPYQLAQFTDNFFSGGGFAGSQLSILASLDPGANLFTSITANGVTKSSASAVYSYGGGVANWNWNTGPFGLVNGSTYPITFAGAPFFSTMLTGSAAIGPIGHKLTITGFSAGTIGSITANAKLVGFQQSSNTGQGAGQSTINYTTGAITLYTSAAPANGDVISASYTQAAPYRVQWSAIGDPTNWPIPLTNAALAAQSGFQDLEPDLGVVMGIVGYPLYALLFQKSGITRAVYQGGNVVFAFATYEFKRGLIAHGAFVQVGPTVYLLSDQGWLSTDGANVNPIGTATDNSAGIDNWFWSNVNRSALEAISGAYDAAMRCVTFAIPTGTNTQPDTLLIYNIIAQRWTKSKLSTSIIWSDTDGTRHRLGVFSQTSIYQLIAGPTVAGYLESCDISFLDGQRRLCTGVRPKINSTDQPLVTVGNRDSLQEDVQYGNGSFPDRFSKIAPALSGGIYTRVRLQSSAASSINAATVLLETEGPM